MSATGLMILYMSICSKGQSGEVASARVLGLAWFGQLEVSDLDCTVWSKIRNSELDP
jgi:hypothetical protein